MYYFQLSLIQSLFIVVALKKDTTPKVSEIVHIKNDIYDRLSTYCRDARQSSTLINAKDVRENSSKHRNDVTKN